MYVNLLTVSFPSQFYKLGNEFCVVPDKWKMDLAYTFCIFSSCDMLKRTGLPVNGWAIKNWILKLLIKCWFSPYTSFPLSFTVHLNQYWEGDRFHPAWDLRWNPHVLKANDWTTWASAELKFLSKLAIVSSRLSKHLFIFLMLLRPCYS